MLASILNSERAIRVSIRIVETFIKMREMIQVSTGLILQLEKLEQKVSKQDEKILFIFEILKKLEQDQQDEENFRQRRRIGFKSSS